MSEKARANKRLQVTNPNYLAGWDRIFSKREVDFCGTKLNFLVSEKVPNNFIAAVGANEKIVGGLVNIGEGESSEDGHGRVETNRGPIENLCK